MAIKSKSELKRLQVQAPEVVARELIELTARVHDQDMQIKQLRSELNAARCANQTMRQAFAKVRQVVDDFCGGGK